MATWHQQKAGLGGLYGRESTGWKVVSDPPGGMASAVTFQTETEAAAFWARSGGVIVEPESAKRTGAGFVASGYGQAWVVALESGAVFLCHVMASDPDTGKAAAIMAAERKGGSPSWDRGNALPLPRRAGPFGPMCRRIKTPDDAKARNAADLTRAIGPGKD